MPYFTAFLLLFFMTLVSACQPNTSVQPESFPAQSVVVFNMADMHSGYDAYPILLDNIDLYTSEHQNSLILFAINGDFFEAGSVVAQQSMGKLDMAFLAALAERGQVIFNIGNHDFDVINMNDFIEQASKIGVRVIGTFSSSQLLTPLPTYTDIVLGQQHLRFIGIDTDHTRTFPASMRDSLTIPPPQKWLAGHYAHLAENADYTVVLSHAGLQTDKAILAFLSAQSHPPLYVLGAHDHLNLQTHINGIPYLHTTFKGQRLVITSLLLSPTQHEVDVDNNITDFSQTGNSAFASEIAATRAQVLAEKDLAIVGVVPTDMSLVEAVDWTLATMRQATGADVALFNHSSFGSGLQQGPLAEYRFNQFMRFENKLMTTTVDGETLLKLLSRANQHQITELEQLSGDFVYANMLSPEPNKRYKIVTTDWVTMADNQEAYLGMTLDFTPVANLTIKALLKQALSTTK